MNNNCEKCTVLSIDSMPLGWNTIVKEDWVDDLSGGTEWKQFECIHCGSIHNIKYRDVGASRSSWFFKNELPKYLGFND